jgi:hypothetical protein
MIRPLRQRREVHAERVSGLVMAIVVIAKRSSI